MFHEIIDSVELVNYNLKMIDNYNDEDDFTSDRKDKHEYYEYQDSIDDDDGDNIKTVPTPIKHKLYEMTFKKEPNQHNHFEIVNDNKDNRILFGLEEQK